MPQLSLHSPLGPLTVSQEDDALVALDWGWGCMQQETELLFRARDQLHAYFDGALVAFDLPLAPLGTAFRLKVWDALRAIPFGATRTYGEIARGIGGSPRAVGQANRQNPLPILIPCHRVVARDGIGGFTAEGGMQTKRFLLDHERDQ
ncbi:methylated-DNA--[protein]-cysteine S-methyltransferase [Lichenicoccus sp.]|uniref:methylated-DNA--[protein]-cysteine S-methyltransferase n=1 Tax=Lichenicoccus sp. TaxID=2781899 RepID=UPI003D1088DF